MRAAFSREHRGETGSFLEAVISLGPCALRGLDGKWIWFGVGSVKPQLRVGFAAFLGSVLHVISAGTSAFHVYLHMWVELELEETESKCSVTGAVGTECSGVVLFWYSSSVQLLPAWLVSVRLDALIVNCKDCFHCLGVY